MDVEFCFTAQCLQDMAAMLVEALWPIVGMGVALSLGVALMNLLLKFIYGPFDPDLSRYRPTSSARASG